MTNKEILCFVNKFRQLMSDGNMAKLVMDCQSGCARVNLEVIFQPGHHPHPQEQQKPHHQGYKRGAAGPACHRRRVRRVQAREAAALAEQARIDAPKNDPVDHVDKTPQIHPPDPAEEAAHHLSLHRVEQTAHNQPLYYTQLNNLPSTPNNNMQLKKLSYPTDKMQLNKLSIPTNMQ